MLIERGKKTSCRTCVFRLSKSVAPWAVDPESKRQSAPSMLFAKQIHRTDLRCSWLGLDSDYFWRGALRPASPGTAVPCCTCLLDVLNGACNPIVCRFMSLDLGLIRGGIQAARGDRGRGVR